MPQTNRFGFAFLQPEHLHLHDSQHQLPASPVLTTAASVQNGESDSTPFAASNQTNSVLEQQYEVVRYLKSLFGGGATPSTILTATGIDLEADEILDEILQRNPKVRIEVLEIEDDNKSASQKENVFYYYRTKFPDVLNRKTLLARVTKGERRQKYGDPIHGISFEDLSGCYPQASQDIMSLEKSGDVIVLKGRRKGEMYIFPRGEQFLVELDGHPSLLKDEGRATTDSPTTDNIVQGAEVVKTDVDPRAQIEAGDAVRIGSEWFRVKPVEHFRGRNAVLNRPITETQIPLDTPLTLSVQAEIQESMSAQKSIIESLALTGSIEALKSCRKNKNGPFAKSAKALASSNAQILEKKVIAEPITKVLKLHEAADESQHLEKVVASKGFELQHIMRRGVTKDLRSLYRGTRATVPRNDETLRETLILQKLIDPDEALQPKRLSSVFCHQTDSTPVKKRRRQKKQTRLTTNAHLDGTELGRVLTLALLDES